MITNLWNYFVLKLNIFDLTVHDWRSQNSVSKPNPWFFRNSNSEHLTKILITIWTKAKMHPDPTESNEWEIGSYFVLIAHITWLDVHMLGHITFVTTWLKQREPKVLYVNRTCLSWQSRMNNNNPGKTGRPKSAIELCLDILQRWMKSSVL